MINKNVQQVLQQINQMTNSVILKYPETVAVSEAQDMLMLVNIQDLDQDEFPDIGLKNSLSEFLNLMKLFPDEREVEIADNVISISSDNIQSSFITDNIQLMDAENKDSSHFAKTESVPTVSEFELTPNDIKQIKVSSGVFKDLNEVIFIAKDSDVSIFLGATNKFNAKSNTFSISKDSNTTKDFEIKIPVDNFKMLPETGYTVHVKYNSAKNAYRILMLSTELQGFKIFMTVKI